METILFAGREHKAFFSEMLTKTRNSDAYHRAFFYAMGICPETRCNIHALFDFKEGGIKPEGLAAAWQTGGTPACAVWPSTSGTAGRRKEKKTVPRPTSCLTGLRPLLF
jgi:hypothetical protein